ncbi:DUF3283 domain-containing protein [Pseudoalteromonas piscicida]|uniref:DUF3283 domain-containing protein n=1 Tax=Pseudoalteromonas piscicida TaxID=43662 RepID=A0AAQ2EX34_PSEO7|nr:MULTISPECIES: DUF3283 family protein [Pseudoalteromonas]KJY90846.1 hypothetical protein TW75_05990 [Pseudoalteromonas piscicida]TMN42805.1 DUF3283 domain-containing protein [Pseudoalteromonas piscicida]TMN45548.1 DUF3283 domain-containing protein [Pseudoalteromonas piscicida]TMN50946.1 DUF3283 domain-containing protein [Pseudoalteromonas piscicida]TMN57705.1 DUF3283 domain-containing protein [Pseudoalteromonas piscicida]
MSYNLCLRPRQEKYQIQLEYEASFWAYQIKRGKKSREAIYDTINQRPLSEQDTLKQKFEYYLSLMLA